ncbi:MAG TPA: VWA domain-containing protein [Thermohalobaculum sp.]|nr:VWA domain-containing protein [Thermohalobaculum sp.]
MLVLDVSNSMWGQIDGVSKIEIAREVIADLLADWPADVELGLVAYGHRRAGDCGDIETVVPVGRVDPRSYAATVNSLVPRGKTPLTDAVRQAAEDLGYRDTPATVVLVSDGVETCEGDPCALAEELERQGVGFTAHVVGFDVSRIEDQSGLQCLAENTGGLYLTADTADELSTAMRTVSAPPPPPAVTLEAVDEDGAPVSDPALAWTVVRLDDEAAIATDRTAAQLRLELEEGRYLARAELGHRAGVAEFDFSAEGDVTQRVVLTPDVSVSAPAEVEAGAEFAAEWTGPDAPGDYLALARPGAPVTEFAAYARTRAGSPLSLTAPEEPGDYEVRYVAASRGQVLAAAPVTVRGPEVTLSAPETVAPGARVAVEWTGPGRAGDFIALVPEGAPAHEAGVNARTDRGSPLTLTAPGTPGDYELRYVGRNGAVLASAPLDVVIPVTLEAPPVVDAGSDIEVAWQGPDNRNDFITIVPAGEAEGKHGTYTYTRNGSPLSVRAPDQPGNYELRYARSEGRETLARLPITVQAVSASLEAPPVIGAGADIEVTWQGPDNRNDYVTIVPLGEAEGKHGTYTYTRNGSPLSVRAPDEPGSYELRYVTGQAKETLARLPITVQAMSASLEAPPVIGAGAQIEVAWQGPDNQNDFITIVPVGEAEGKHGDYDYTRKGSPLSVRAPDQPGSYELRYVTGQTRETLARLPITVQAVSASLEAPPVIGAGSDIEVAWQGPDNQNDFVTIVPAGEAEGKHGNYGYTRKGSPLSVRAPDQAGSYELRYVTGQARETLARLPITVQAVSASLEAPPVADAAGQVAVTWEGPDNRSDFITIVPVGEAEGKHGNYSYTRRGSPVAVKTPDEPGSYELRYVTGQSRKTLARLPIRIQ